MNKSDVIDLMAEVGLKAPVRGDFVFISWDQLVALVQKAEKVEPDTKCIVKDCENHKHEGRFIGPLCSPCHTTLSTGEGKFSQAWRNTRQAVEAETDACAKVKVTKAIPKRYKEVFQHVFEDGVKFGKAELRKAIRARSKV